MYIRQIKKNEKAGNTAMWVVIGLIAGLGIAAAGYAVFNLSWGMPGGISKYDTGVNNGQIPSIGDYLFGNSDDTLTGFNTGTNNSGDVLTGTQLTGDTNIPYPTGYVDQFNKALLILQNDSLVNTYIDTDNLTMSGFANISISNSSTGTVAPKFLLQGRIAPTIQNLYILGANNNGAYMFEPINFTDNTWSFQLDPNNDSIKPGGNNYYIIGKNQEGMYNVQYISVRTYESGDFYAALDKICILDVCSDPSLPKRIQDASSTIYQQSADGRKVIQIIPNISIIIGTQCTNGSIAIEQVKKIGNNFLKVNKGCNYMSEGITQSLVDTNNQVISTTNSLANIPSVLQFGNIKYTPTLLLNKSAKQFIRVNQLSNSLISDNITATKVIADEYAFELPDNLFVSYTVDKTQLNYLRPSNSNGTYRVIPKVASWMNKAMVYTIPSDDIGLHDSITAYFKGSRISTQNNCSNPKPNADPMAKFGLFPINEQYDVVGFWNCYEAK